MTEPSTTPKFYPLVYYVKEKDLGSRRFETQIHKTRDGLSLMELFPILLGCGYTYGATILNVPEKHQRTLAREGRLKENNPHVANADMVLLATRPALDDDEQQERPVLRSNCELEQAAFRALRPLFDSCE